MLSNAAVNSTSGWFQRLLLMVWSLFCCLSLDIGCYFYAMSHSFHSWFGSFGRCPEVSCDALIGFKRIVFMNKLMFSGNIGVFDPAEIYNRGMIKRHLRETMIYLGFYLIIFFMYLYWWVHDWIYYYITNWTITFFQYDPSNLERWSNQASPWRWNSYGPLAVGLS